MRPRRGDVIEEQVELLEDDGWGDATPVTRAPRWRRKELLLLAALVAVVVGIGATSGSGGGDEDRADRPASTTTTRRTATTRPRASTTTTTWPALVAGTGPVLGTETDTWLVVIEDSGDIAVLDLDTGDLCRVDQPRHADAPAWQPQQQQQQLAPRATVDGDRGLPVMVGRRCEVHDVSAHTRGWPSVGTETSVWTVLEGPSNRLVELALGDGAELRSIEVPSQTTIVSDRRSMVLGAAGQMVAIDLATGRPTELGGGTPLVIGGRTLLATRCEGLDCHMVRIEVDSGRARTLDLARPAGWEPLSLSEDGRWLHYTWSPDGQTLRQSLVDMSTGAVTDGIPGPCGFTADSRWLVCGRSTVIDAMRVEDGHRIDLTARFDGPVQAFTLLG